MLNVPLKNYPFNFDDQYGLSAVTIMGALVDPVYKPFKVLLPPTIELSSNHHLLPSDPHHGFILQLEIILLSLNKYICSILSKCVLIWQGNPKF